MPETLISINEAVQKGIERLCEPKWILAEDHLKLDILESGRMGPWIHLYSSYNKECNGHDPVNIICLEWGDFNEKIYLPYDGLLPESEEYKAKVKTFEGVTDEVLD